MTKRKEKTPEQEWISTQEAARILTEQSGHPVSDTYVRLLGNKGKLTTKPIDARTKLYLKSDVLAYHVKQRKIDRKQLA